MIIDAILGVILGLIEALLGAIMALIPTVPVWFTAAIGALGELTSTLGALDAWLPVNLMLSIAAAVMAAWAASIVIAAIRWIASYFLGGGGTT